MKKLLLLSLLFLITGCSEQNLVTIIEASEIELPEQAYLLDTVMDDHLGDEEDTVWADLTGDGIEEEILMYITPSPFDEETGEATMWEHLHLWHLIVKEGEKTYTLFNDNVRGTLSFWVTETPETRLLLVDQSGVQLIVYEFKYNNGVFERSTLVDTDITWKRSQIEW